MSMTTELPPVTNQVVSLCNNTEFDEVWNVHTPKYVKRMGKELRLEFRRRLAEAQNWRCCYCGDCMDDQMDRPTSATAERIVLRRDNGPYEEYNLVMVCKSCYLVRAKSRGYWSVHVRLLVEISDRSLSAVLSMEQQKWVALLRKSLKSLAGCAE